MTTGGKGSGGKPPRLPGDGVKPARRKPMDTIAAFEAVNWVQYRRFEADYPCDQVSGFHSKRTWEEWIEAERDLVAQLAAGALEALVCDPKPNWPRPGDNPTILNPPAVGLHYELPPSFWVKQEFGIWPNGAISGRPRPPREPPTVSGGVVLVDARFYRDAVLGLWPDPEAGRRHISDAKAREWMELYVGWHSNDAIHPTKRQMTDALNAAHPHNLPIPHRKFNLLRESIVPRNWKIAGRGRN